MLFFTFSVLVASPENYFTRWLASFDSTRTLADRGRVQEISLFMLRKCIMKIHTGRAGTFNMPTSSPIVGVEKRGVY